MCVEREALIRYVHALSYFQTLVSSRCLGLSCQCGFLLHYAKSCLWVFSCISWVSSSSIVMTRTCSCSLLMPLTSVCEFLYCIYLSSCFYHLFKKQHFISCDLLYITEAQRWSDILFILTHFEYISTLSSIIKQTDCTVCYSNWTTVFLCFSHPSAEAFSTSWRRSL